MEAINTLAIAEFGGESVQDARDSHVLAATCRDGIQIYTFVIRQ